ncbi:hypothetical protein QQS21_007483 [Conoideocrella luteorostrata]|uniref:Uncharacterized protein n=1 Tax=Conoideocrella luteorostrata TaxID=1105319 RepID=A0AAJ0CKM0_9HYPO|nr:hypothetical protein QQS21_007483 [Conoideocrella luteorostrata]
MSSPPRSSPGESAASAHSSEEEDQPAGDDTVTLSDMGKQPESQRDVTETYDDQHQNGTPSLSPPPADIAPFDWEDFEARYGKALRDADEEEREILKEAESLSKYFQAWASAASAHDDERAVKRLRTRQRFVNLSEEKMAQKQKHYEEVVRAFESALALLKSS